MKTLGQFIVGRRKELGLSGREVVAGVRNADGKRSGLSMFSTVSFRC